MATTSSFLNTNPRTPYAMYEIRMFLINWGATKSDLANILALNPRPWFADEDEAYRELLELCNFIDEVSDTKELDARYKFFRHNIEKLFLDECPRFKSFWLLQRDRVIDPVIKHPCFKYIDRVNKKNAI